MENLNIGTKVRINYTGEGGIFYGVVGVIIDFAYGYEYPCIVKCTLPDGDNTSMFCWDELEPV